MPKKDMRAALASSLQAEDEAVKNRFERAESLFGGREEAPTSLSVPADTSPQPRKDEKPKVVRDSFTIPELDYALISTIRQRCLASAVNVNKGEVVRAGLHALQNMPDEQLLQIMEGLEKVKTGRPPSRT
jgi:hypothetical protein